MNALAEIRRRRAEIARLLDALASEDHELATTENVLERLERGEGAAPGGLTAPRSWEPAALRPRSQREFVIDALARAEAPWMRASDIVLAVKRHWGEDIRELSLRPLLTALKKARVIVRSGRVVALRQRAHDTRAGQAPRTRNASG